MSQVCCGYYHTILLSQTGSVFGFGRNDYGQLGLGHTQPRMYGLTPNMYLRDKNVISLSAGCYHSVAVTTNGMLYVFGRNNHGQLGTGDVEEKHFPHPVDDFVGKKIIQVAAGFYHTIVLLGSHDNCIQEKSMRMSEKRIDVEGIASISAITNKRSVKSEQSSCDGSVDDYPQTCHLHSDTEQSLNNNNRDSVVKTVNSLDGCNVEFKELFMFTIAHLEQSMNAKPVSAFLSHKFWNVGMRSEDAVAGLNWASLQLNTFAVLLQMCRQYLNGTLAIDVPFSQEEILLSMMSVIGLVEKFMHDLDGERVLSVCKVHDTCQDDESISDLFAHYSPSFPVFNFDNIVEKLTPTCFSSSTDSAGLRIGNELTLARDTFVDCIRNIRQELLFSYFFFSESFEICSSVCHRCGVIISKNFDFLFWSNQLQTNVFSFLAEVLTEEPTVSVDLFDTSFTSLSSCVEMDPIDFKRGMSLLAKFCTKYKNLPVVLELFRRSILQGLEMYHKLLKVYQHLSVIRVKNVCDRRTGQDSNEFGRIFGLLEHCCTHFTKCAIPLVLSSDQSVPQTNRKPERRNDTMSMGRLIIDGLLSTADAIIEILMELTVDDAKDILNSETNFPIVLPTFLLYMLSDIEAAHFKFDILPAVNSLIEKIQKMVCTLDLDCNTLIRVPLTPKKRLEEVSTTSRCSTESLSQKKDFSQTAWWVRLLKICSIMSAKLSSVLLLHQSSGSSCEYSFSKHMVWNYWAGPENNAVLVDLDFDSDMIQIDHMLVEFRQCARLKHSLYRSILVAASNSKTIDVLSGIESCIISTLRKSCNLSRFCPSDVSSIVSIVTFIYNQRSVLMSRCNGLTWTEMLSIMYSVVKSFSSFMGKCSDKTSIAPLCLPAKKRLHSAFRRSLLIVLCVNRWKRCVKNKFSCRKSSVIDAFRNILNLTVFSVTLFDENTVVNAWVRAVESLKKTVVVNVSQAMGMESMSNLLLNTPQTSIRVDIMALLITTWKESIVRTDLPGQCHVSNKFECTRHSQCTYSTLTSKSRKKSALLFLVNVVQNSVKSFCHGLCEGVISTSSSASDLNLFCCNIKFLQLVFVDDSSTIATNYFVSTLKQLTEALVVIDEKFAELQGCDDKGGGGAGPTKRQSSREKSIYLKRASSAIVRLLQMVAMSSVNAGLDFSAYCAKLICDAHIYLVKHFQNARMAVKSDYLSSFHNESKEGRAKDVNSHRRRCQELIVNPMQFSRHQEGFVVQGEKLLSNFKGIDFTLACWVFISNRSSSRSSFLVGKVSHNDAWPLITLRAADNKVEIIFGRANEFDRLTSHASIPLHTWTHIAIVVEPRKIKLFVNGSVDCQMTTAGNARAILYPVIIGACPSGVRTRVDCIKEGFDGLLSNLKYYTRALSPIHVRVIFDKGPPEANDIREYLCYQLLASSICQIGNLRFCQNPELSSGLLEMFHYLFLSDSSRLRIGSLKVLQRILSVETVGDFRLSRNDLVVDRKNHHLKFSSECKPCPAESVMTVEFLKPFTTFRERIIYYFIKLMGFFWYQCNFGRSDRPYDDILKYSDCEFLDDFLSYSPSFVHSDLSDGGADGGNVCGEGGAIEIPVPREDLVIETSQAINDVLRALSHKECWRNAISSVFRRCSDVYLDQLTKGMHNFMINIDIFGVSIAVGGLSLCPYLGATVQSIYCRQPCVILNIDKATGQSTLLTTNSSRKSVRFLTVKTSELLGISLNNDFLAVSNEYRDIIIQLLLKLYHGITPAFNDCLAVPYGDQAAIHSNILKKCHPHELFLFHQFLRSLSLAQDIALHRNDFFDVLKFLSIRAVNNRAYNEEVANHFDNEVSVLWMRCLHYISSATGCDEKVCTSSTKDDSSSTPEESELCESMISSHMDISPECFRSCFRHLLMSGHVTEFIYCSSLNSEGDVKPTSLPGAKEVPSHKFSVDVATLVSRNNIQDTKAKLFFQLLLEMRTQIIINARKILRSEITRNGQMFGGLDVPWKVAIWQSVIIDRKHRVMWDEGDSYKVANCLTIDRNKVTSSIIDTIQYAVTTLFQRKSNEMFAAPDNFLMSTDVLSRLLWSAESWLRVHGGFYDECDVCFEFLSAFLPLFPLIKGLNCEEELLTLCDMSISRILLCLYNGKELSNDIMKIADSALFSNVWSRCQEQLIEERGQSTHTFSAAAQRFASIAATFTILQRWNRGVIASRDYAYDKLQKSSEIKSILLSSHIPPLTVRAASAQSAEFDLSAASDMKGSFVSMHAEFLLQVVLCVHTDGSSTSGLDSGAFETIYCGTSLNFVYVGLSPSSLYCVKYRVICLQHLSNWSNVTEFRTEAGTTPFVFDTKKCGPDIVLSNDGRVASYRGDDNWSTVLGSVPFASGINSWEIKIVTSSTAYIFIGIASSLADLNTFLGGCSEGWGFIGEQALYHGREKVKIYGEPFSAGDVVGVILDFNSGTLSFTKNGKTLGIAFDRIYGELFPAIAFYNVGQEVEIVSDSFRTFCPPVPFPCSPSVVNLDQFSLVSEMVHCIALRRPFSMRLLDMISTHLKSWASGTVIRRKAVSGRFVFLNQKSQLLLQYGLRCGDRVRTQYGIAQICGSAYGRIWFSTKEKNGVWYFSKQQISAGKAKGLFQRCTYQDQNLTDHAHVDDESKSHADIDLSSLQELLDPERWTTNIDGVLVKFLQEVACEDNITPWEVTAKCICDSFRKVQLKLSRFVMDSADLSHKWGITGPKRKAVLARIAVLRLYNHLLEHSLPLLLPGVHFEMTDAIIPGDDISYSSLTLLCPPELTTGTTINATIKKIYKTAPWFVHNASWKKASPEASFHAVSSSDISPMNNLRCLSRSIMFSDMKRNHFWKILQASTARVSKTDDDYDYPEDLPLVKLNRFKSYRALDIATQMGLSGEDMILSSMFCQLWRELKHHSPDKLRISYTHPMDDGQSRTFKVKFEGEGVDDYGGPYREVFQIICEELKTLASSGKKSSDKCNCCFFPILHPTPNWNAEGSGERYKFTFLPFSSGLRLELYRFLGHLVGIALRSKITLELPLASYIWKAVVREPLTNIDIQSFDAPSSKYVEYLSTLHDKIGKMTEAASQRESVNCLSEELENILQDVTWTVKYSDGSTCKLIEDGDKKLVCVDDLSQYLQLHAEARLGECYEAVEAFREGILWVIPKSAISVLSGDELEHLVCGSKRIDVNRLKQNTEYDDDISCNDTHIVNFWEILEGFTELEKSLFLRFVWARPSLPPSGVDFPQKLKIQSAVGDDSALSPDSYLPKAHTCFFSINLPRYSSKEIMRDRLLYAITHCTEMDADFRVAEEEVIGWSSLPTVQNWSNYTGID